MKIIAIIGQSASGKSDIAHEIAKETGAALLSMDSLAVYKNIEIASAKPNKNDREGLAYFGLDLVTPNEKFGAEDFIREFLKARDFCRENNRDLIIVGGSAFYLKCLTSGLSKLPEISEKTREIVNEKLLDLNAAFNELKSRDPIYAIKIKNSDRYRIEKALLIMIASDIKPSEWFSQNPPEALLDELAIFLVELGREELLKRIKLRTEKMIEIGLVDEVKNLLAIADRGSQPMKAIGITETIDFIDEKISLKELSELITIHTAQFTKRQKTYYKGQFNNLIAADKNSLIKTAIKYLNFSR
ncbi:MAG: tRNA (adenosine(37)-N6)-dimethylallyltransferase MiaA [Helicobacteraceae bacterium]|jgi:tRNA dimethylallyltransferase|nr:tRNA (adenosine(37)-N6)-dimethylallyltransferase MiaA [Helicobacteraceae bacterium]